MKRLPSDEQLLLHLRRTPELSDRVESLNYWQERHQRLSWYRIGARREALRMIRRWEDRLRETVLWQPSIPVAARISGGLLIARGGLRRWKRRAAIGATVTVGVALVTIAVPLIALTLFVLRVA